MLVQIKIKDHLKFEYGTILQVLDETKDGLLHVSAAETDEHAYVRAADVEEI